MWLCVCGPNILSTKKPVYWLKQVASPLLIPALFFNNECL